MFFCLAQHFSVTVFKTQRKKTNKRDICHLFLFNSGEKNSKDRNLQGNLTLQFAPVKKCNC